MLPYLDDFLLNLQVNNYSDETVYNYERDLKLFSEFLESLSLSFEQTNKNVINNFKAYLVSIDRKTSTGQKVKGKLASRSLNRTLSSLRSYLRYLIEMDIKTPIVPDNVKLVRTEKKHAQVAELKDLIRLIESPTLFEENKLIGIRNRTMLEVLFSTGMRISELVNLKRAQIDDTGRIFIMGKGKKERFVYLTPRAYDWLKQYLRFRTDTFPKLFVPKRGLNAKIKEKGISANYLQERIKRYRELLKINVPTSAHSLRHGFATYLAEQGANPAALQILLGHESLDTTTKYVHASDKYAEDTHRKYHPLKNRE